MADNIENKMNEYDASQIQVLEGHPVFNIQFRSYYDGFEYDRRFDA